MVKDKFILIVGLVLIVILLSVPIIFLRLNNPVLLLDILFTANILLVLLMFFFSFFKKTKNISFFPKLYFITSCIGLVMSCVFLFVYFNVTTYINTYLINFVSLIFSKLKIENLVTPFFILTLLIFEIIFSRSLNKDAEETNDIALFEFPLKKMNIEKKYIEGTISEKEVSARTNQLNWEIEILNYIVKVNKLIYWCLLLINLFVISLAIINIIIFVIQKLSFLPISIIEYEEVVEFSSAALISFTFTLFPVFLLFIVSRIIISRINKKDENDKIVYTIKRHSESYTIEIGFELSSIILQANLPLLLDKIKNSISSSDTNIEFIIPMINDNFLMERFEYRIYINDIVMYRGFIQEETETLNIVEIIANKYFEVLNKFRNYKNKCNFYRSSNS
jgi:hypothetical protein